MDENGLLLKFVAKKLNFVSSSLSRWRGGGFDYGEEKLDIIERFLYGDSNRDIEQR